VFECKIDESHCSKTQIEFLYKCFLEAKWMYNHVLSLEDVFAFDTKAKTVNVLNKDKEIEERNLENLSSQMKQGLYNREKDSIINLSKAKKKGIKIGRLKFKSVVNSIPLQQNGKTYRILNKGRIALQGCKKPFKVNGLKQIPDDADITCATLVKKENEYYIKITCF